MANIKKAKFKNLKYTCNLCNSEKQFITKVNKITSPNSRNEIPEWKTYLKNVFLVTLNCCIHIN